MPVTAYIGLGSNLGDKKGNCVKALELLGRAGRVSTVSSFYCTEPVGPPDQEDFINAVVELETDLSAEQVTAACHAIEDELGRSRTVRWGPRPIDLDLLLYGEAVITTPGLTVPHPFLALRGFVLFPLAEIAPQAMHPLLHKTTARLLEELKDSHRVARCGPQEQP
jgi:2-amino-4-hydroxy-6-hydroxymethyldihydropteridine diphosphokinase